MHKQDGVGNRPPERPERLSSLPREDPNRRHRGMASSNTATHNVQSFPRGYDRSMAMPLRDQQSQKTHKLDPTTKEKYFDKWTNFRMKMNKGLIEMINNPRLKKRIDKGAVPFFRADKNMCHFVLDQATEEYLEGRKLKPTLMAETFVEFGIPRAQLAPSESQVGSDMNNNSQVGIAKQHTRMKQTKKLERKYWNETDDDPTPIPKPRKKKKHKDYVDGGKMDGYRYKNEVLSPVTASGIPRDAQLYVNTSSEAPTTLGERDRLLYNITPNVVPFARVQQPLYVNIPQNSFPSRNQIAYVHTPPIIQPSNPSDNFVPPGKSNYLPHRYLPNSKPEIDNDDDTVTAISTEPDFEELSQFRAHGHNKRAPPPPPPVPPHRTPMPTYVNQMDISSEFSSTSRPLSRYTGDSIGGSMFGRQDKTLTGKLSAVKWSNKDSNAAPSRNRKTSLRSYNTHATWKTNGTFIAKRHPEDAGIDEMTFGIGEYVIDNASNGQNSIMIMDGVNGENRSTFESELLY